jgi:hypothetical protein
VYSIMSETLSIQSLEVNWVAADRKVADLINKAEFKSVIKLHYYIMLCSIH